MVHTAPHQSNETRLALCERSPHRGGVDGAWWPKTADLRTELPDLVAVLSLQVGPVRRVLYDPRRWPAAPARIIRGAVSVSVEPYSMVASDTVYLKGTHSRDASLFVVPPRSSVETARRVLRAVAESTLPLDVVMMRHLLADGVGVV